jgi:hypothetical protein
LAWVLDNLEWSHMFLAADKAPDRRKNSVSYVELACIADVLTGGAIGPRKSTFAEKAAIIKEGIAQLTKKTKVADDEGRNLVNAERFMYQLPNVPSAAATGFSTLPGISRRPILAKFPGLHAAVGALLTFAKNEEKVLESIMPRYTWIRPSSKEDSLLSTWEQIMARRAGEPPKEDDIIPNLQPVLLLPNNKEKDIKPDTQTARRRVALTGPCTFGCQSTKERSRGKQVWRRVPSPSPWSTVPAGATLCRKCYERAMVLIRRGRGRGNPDADGETSGNAHTAGDHHRETGEECLATEQGTSHHVNDDSQPCTERTRSVHEDDGVVTDFQNKRRRLSQVDREEGHRTESESFMRSRTSFLYSSDKQGLVDVRPLCTANLKDASNMAPKAANNSFVDNPVRQGVVDVRPFCTANQGKQTVSSSKSFLSSEDYAQVSTNNSGTAILGGSTVVHTDKRKTASEASYGCEALATKQSSFSLVIDAMRDQEQGMDETQSVFGVISARKSRWSANVCADLECTRAKRARCESHRLPSSACSSGELLNPEFATGCWETARLFVRDDERPQGAVTIGDGGMRPPDPMQSVSVQSTARPPGSADPDPGHARA